MRVADLLDGDGNRNRKKFPAVEALGSWDASCPRVAISEDGIILAAAFPNYLREKAHVRPLWEKWRRRDNLLRFFISASCMRS